MPFQAKALVAGSFVGDIVCLCPTSSIATILQVEQPALRYEEALRGEAVALVLIPCPACDRPLSPKAVSCPNCGHPLRRAGDDLQFETQLENELARQMAAERPLAGSTKDRSRERANTSELHARARPRPTRPQPKTSVAVLFRWPVLARTLLFLVGCVAIFFAAAAAPHFFLDLLQGSKTEQTTETAASDQVPVPPSIPVRKLPSAGNKTSNQNPIAVPPRKVSTTKIGPSGETSPAIAPAPVGTAVISPTVPAANFEFRGHRVGEDVNLHFSYWSEGFRSLDLPYCSELKVPGHVQCDDPTVDVKDQYISYKAVGGVTIQGLYYSFYQGHLYGVDMWFMKNRFLDIRAMLEGKYGKPDREKAGTVQNAMGASFDNVEADWAFKEGTLSLKMIAGDINTSWMSFAVDDVASRIAAKEQEMGKSKGKTAF